MRKRERESKRKKYESMCVSLYAYSMHLFWYTLLGLTTIEVLWPVGRPTDVFNCIFSSALLFFVFVVLPIHLFSNKSICVCNIYADTHAYIYDGWMVYGLRECVCTFRDCALYVCLFVCV